MVYTEIASEEGAKVLLEIISQEVSIVMGLCAGWRLGQSGMSLCLNLPNRLIVGRRMW